MEFAEKDDETGYNQFEARLYDSRLGRWLSFDPAGQYYSPYLGMGNNPVMGVDPDGRFFGQIRSWFAYNFSASSTHRFKNSSGDWEVRYSDGKTRNYVDGWFGGRNTPLGIVELGELKYGAWFDDVVEIQGSRINPNLLISSEGRPLATGRCDIAGDEFMFLALGQSVAKISAWALRFAARGVRGSYKAHFSNWKNYAYVMKSRGITTEHIAKRMSNARLAARSRYQLQTPFLNRMSIYVEI